jgi:hypothetical protein
MPMIIPLVAWWPEAKGRAKCPIRMDAPSWIVPTVDVPIISVLMNCNTHFDIVLEHSKPARFFTNCGPNGDSSN